MKLNNKGMSLLELLTTIVLVSIVLLFLFRLLGDLQQERVDEDYAYKNQINHAEIIYTIQKDLNFYTLKSIEDTSSNNISITFNYQKEGENKRAVLFSSISDGKHYLNYNSDDLDFKNQWEMKDAIIDPCVSFTSYRNSGYYYFKLNINVYNATEHPRNKKCETNNNDLTDCANNFVDDIEITFASPIDNLDLTGNNLINNSPSKIGYCSN